MTAAADEAVAYLLRRISSDARLAYYFGMTESLALLTKAHAEANGLDVEIFRKEYDAALSFEAPVCRECREKAEG